MYKKIRVPDLEFTIQVCVSSDKKGVPLAKEYNRLKFEGPARKADFGIYWLNIVVPENIAIKYEHFFEDSEKHTIKIDSINTNAWNYEKISVSGLVRLASIDINIEKMESLIAKKIAIADMSSKRTQSLIDEKKRLARRISEIDNLIGDSYD